MSEHRATVGWKRETPAFAYETYSRDHDWSFDSGVTVRASANPAYLGSESCVDPEEAFVAALSSCHMLTFLAVAARKKYVVDAYHDEAVGSLDKDAGGRLAITRVRLRPRVRFGGEKQPTPEELRQLHDQAHYACFIANSVKTSVLVEPIFTAPLPTDDVTSTTSRTHSEQVKSAEGGESEPTARVFSVPVPPPDDSATQIHIERNIICQLTTEHPHPCPNCQRGTVVCSKCGGDGFDPGTPKTECQRCNRSGWYDTERRLGCFGCGGEYKAQGKGWLGARCTLCDGRGEIHCPECGGKHYLPLYKALSRYGTVNQIAEIREVMCACAEEPDFAARGRELHSLLEKIHEFASEESPARVGVLFPHGLCL